MSRYIDADALKEWLDEYLSVFKKYDKGTIKGFVDHAPSIDIVRCKECKWASPNGKYGCMLKPFSKNDWQYHHLFSDDFCSYGSRSEKPNNCEHITEDGVTCAKYPACDDCLDNPLNKVKGSKRLVKGSDECMDELMGMIADRPQGKWLLSDLQSQVDNDNGNYAYVCTNCNHTDIHAKTQKVPYCWWCGAKMKGADDE